MAAQVAPASSAGEPASFFLRRGPGGRRPFAVRREGAGPLGCLRRCRPPGEAQSEFEAELKSAGEKLIVVDFSATWCGPCKMIKPFFHSLCEKYADVVFIEIDVDDAQDVATHCDVKCMPTFQFYKKGKKVQEFSGANKEKLEETIKSLA
ncbi:PREDICTED: thioredoxin-like [Nipponia nippon]|nr:PREDICTED: thioredoxin-like [Nipponia nippon]